MGYTGFSRRFFFFLDRYHPRAPRGVSPYTSVGGQIRLVGEDEDHVPSIICVVVPETFAIYSTRDNININSNFSNGCVWFDHKERSLYEKIEYRTFSGTIIEFGAQTVARDSIFKEFGVVLLWTSLQMPLYLVSNNGLD